MIKKEIKNPYLIREKIFNKIMVSIRKCLYFLLRLDRHKDYESDKNKDGFFPLLSYNSKLKTYRFNCYCFSCPCNSKGLCVTEFSQLPTNILHEFDGDNIIKNFCG
jgi:hypothetical protein